MRTLKRALLVTGWAALAASSSPATAQNLVSMAEVVALISGNTVHFEDLSNGRTGRAHYEASGQFVTLRDDGVELSGLWSVRPDGAHCTIVSNEICGKIEKNADGSYTRIVVGTPAFKWTKITPGKGF